MFKMMSVDSRTSLFMYACREYFPANSFGFCDSSSSAYCAVIYSRRETCSGVYTNLLAAKTRVAPLKGLTIPRLELLSCLLLVELLGVVISTLNYVNTAEIFCWSDSEISLCWIRGVHKQWNPWVENRVVKIRNLRSPRDWYHVPGSLNPADVATRPISAKDLNCDSVWFMGPKFLYSTREHWPRDQY